MFVKFDTLARVSGLNEQKKKALERKIKIHYCGQYTSYCVSDYQAGKKETQLRQSKRRYYTIKRKHKQEIVSSALFGLHNKAKEDTMCFVTLTYEGCVNSKTGVETLDSQFNPVYNDSVSDFFNEMRQRRNCTGYLWTKELTEQQVIHYHCLYCISQRIEKGYVKSVNDMWCKYRGYHTPNALRVGQLGIIVDSATAAAGYAAKYAAKGNARFISPAYRISETWKVKPQTASEYKNKDVIDYIEDRTIAYKDADWARMGYISIEDSRELFDSL